jgi:hypothetical protein
MFCVDIGALKTISMAIWMSASAKIGNARRKRSHPGPKCSSKTDPPPSISCKLVHLQGCQLQGGEGWLPWTSMPAFAWVIAMD